MIGEKQNQWKLSKHLKVFRNSFQALPWRFIREINTLFLLFYLIWEVIQYSSFWIILILRGWIEWGAFIVLVVTTVWLLFVIIVVYMYLRIDFGCVKCDFGFLRVVVNVLVSLGLIYFLVEIANDFSRCTYNMSNDHYELQGRTGEKTLYFLNCFLFADIYKVNGNWNCLNP